MKIAMMTNSYKPFVAGVPISIERLTDSLRQLGHQVVVFAPGYKEEEKEQDVVRYRALLKGVAGGFSVPDCLDPVIEREFKEGNFDVIHVHHPMLIGDTARYLSGKYKVPLVFTYHTRYEQYLHYIGLSSFKNLIPAYIRGCMKRCDVVIAPTPLMKEYLKGIAAAAQIRGLPTGLEESSFLPDQEAAEKLRKELAGDKNYLFCTVARLAKEKNIEFLLRSLKIRKDTVGSDFRLALVGDGPWKGQLKKLTAQLGLEEEIIFTGKIPNASVKNYCKASDLFLFASESETQGIVLLESMAAGTPVLAVRATGTEDVVINGKNGYMTETSEMEFAEKIMDILQKRELELLRQGAAATAKEYDCRKIAKAAAAIYGEAVKLSRQRMKQDNRGKKRYFTGERDVVYFHG